MSTPERFAMIARQKAEWQSQLETQAAEFVKTPEGIMLVKLDKYLKALGYVAHGWKFERLLPNAWGYYLSGQSECRAAVYVLPEPEPGACAVRVVSGRVGKLYAITTPSPGETLERLREFRVDGLPVVEWARDLGGEA